MTLKEAFEAMRPEHRPSLEMSKSGALWWVNTDAVGFTSTPDSLAESAICWAMTRALRDAKHCPRFWIDMVETDYGHCFEGQGLDALAAAYAAVFPKEKA